MKTIIAMSLLAPLLVFASDWQALGSGTLKVAWVKVYDLTLHVEDPDHRQRILEDVPKKLQVDYRAKVPARKFIKAGRKILRETWGESELEAIAAELDLIDSWYLDVKPGDTAQLIYEPGIGTSLVQNGTKSGTIPGKKFAQLYFAIWLGPSPASEALRDELLGQG